MQKVLLTAAALALGTSSASAYINCAIDLKPVERMICSSPGLLELDASMSSHYFRLHKLLSRRDASELQDNQRDWLVLRNQCDTYACLRQMYSDRIQELKFVIK